MIADETMKAKGWKVGDTLYERVSRKAQLKEGNRITEIGEIRVEKIEAGSSRDPYYVDANVQTVTLENVVTKKITTRYSQNFPIKNPENSTPSTLYSASDNTISDAPNHPTKIAPSLPEGPVFPPSLPEGPVYEAVKSFVPAFSASKITEQYNKNETSQKFLDAPLILGVNKYSIVSRLYNADGTKKILEGGGKRRRKTNRKRRRTNRKRRRTNRRR